MTIDEFLDRLRQTPRDWGLVARSLRRGDDGLSACPITSLMKEPWDASMWEDSADVLSLDEHAATDIMMAADAWDDDGYYNRPLRARLFDACGLSPEADQ